MTDADLACVRKTYNQLKKLQEAVNKLKLAAQELETNEFQKMREIPEYQNILKELMQLPRGTSIDSDEAILDIASQEILGTIYGENMSKIYVYLKSYTYATSKTSFDIIEVPYDYQGIHWREYRDIEARKGDSNMIVYSNFFRTFCEQNQILFAPNNVDPKQFYQEVRMTYFQTAIEKSQEEACKVIYKRYLLNLDS